MDYRRGARSSFGTRRASSVSLKNNKAPAICKAAANVSHAIGPSILRLDMNSVRDMGFRCRVSNSERISKLQKFQQAIEEIAREFAPQMGLPEGRTGSGGTGRGSRQHDALSTGLDALNGAEGLSASRSARMRFGERAIF